MENEIFRTYKFNNSTLDVIFGNIIDSEAEVIVSSDDNLLSMGGGVSRSIMNASQSPADWENIDSMPLTEKLRYNNQLTFDAHKLTPLPLGDVAVTTAGAMRQKYIFHAITIDFYKKNEPKDEEASSLHKYIITHSIDKCFRLLNALDITSIAFPCLGAGCAQIPYKTVAGLMAETICNHLLKTNKTYHIELYLYDRYHKMQLKDYMIFFEKISKYVPEEEEDEEERTVSPQPLGTQDVFLSYSRKDADEAMLMYESLRQNGISCWIDQSGINHGDDFKEEIVHAIKGCKVFIFLSSENSNSSRNTVKEVGIAEREGKTVIPVRLDNSSYHDAIYYDLVNKNWIDFRKSTDRKFAFQELCNEILLSLENAEKD